MYFKHKICVLWTHHANMCPKYTDRKCSRETAISRSLETTKVSRDYMTDSKELVVPSDDPWMSHAFISKIAAQVSLPYRRLEMHEIVKRFGLLVVHFICGAVCFPYGNYSRLFELWACTMIKTGDDCWNPETRTLNLGSSFRAFLRLLNVNVGGRQLKVIKSQFERLFSCTYQILNLTDPNQTDMAAFVVAPREHIDWQNETKPLKRGENADNWVTLSNEYVRMLQDSPVPVDLPTVAKIKSPMALDVYWWLTKRYYNMHDRVSIKWQKLYDQFGSDSAMNQFRRNFKQAVAEVLEVYPAARITCGLEYVTLWPSQTSVPTVAQTCSAEHASARTVDAQIKDAEEITLGEIYKQVQPEDLLKYGLIPEFVGRLPVIATLDDLNEEALVKVLTEPKNALLKQYKTLFEMEDVKLTITDDALKAIAKKAIERKTGARGLRAIMEENLLDLMYDIPDKKDVTEIIIDAEVINNGSAPEYIRKKHKKSA